MGTETENRSKVVTKKKEVGGENYPPPSPLGLSCLVATGFMKFGNVKMLMLTFLCSTKKIFFSILG